MDVDSSSNAVAGPSTLPDSISPFLPPQGPPRPSPYFTSTEDLLTKFRLLPAYDKYVRPLVNPLELDGSIDKGKGKERESSPSPRPASALGNDLEDEDSDKRKKKNSYKHLIKGIPGKHSTKRDDFLTTTMQVPPKQRISITPFDLKTQSDAFAVSLDGLKGWNIGALIAETPQAKEDRKRRKEMKRLAKAQAISSASHAFQTTSTPGVSAHSTPPLPTISASSPTPSRAPTPKQTVVHPGSRPPISISSTNVESPRSTPSDLVVKKGKKREHEDSVIVHSVPQQQLQQASAMVGAKAGISAVRPRPLKKQRVDFQGQAREISVHQQPTPQGV